LDREDDLQAGHEREGRKISYNGPNEAQIKKLGGGGGGKNTATEN